MSAYLAGEAQVSVENYRLLESMNMAAAKQYKGMSEYTADLAGFADQLHVKCDELLPKLAQVVYTRYCMLYPCTQFETFHHSFAFVIQIDALELQVSDLEASVEHLDRYSRRLESEFMGSASP